ncbi:MAG: class I SAM-dependent methyltransferase [Candidatus Omnitrophota bacterium]|jgi:ubiquinone/menaquinone biosynthesis C-methylase UbiE|nr:MAG: class I SAM-dependent methyltransferase [Candidatus Omnitrophota bacterium]
MAESDKEKKTSSVYSYLWRKADKDGLLAKSHYERMQEVIPEQIIRGCRGLEVGSGCGCDTLSMAKANKSVMICSLELSDGIYETKDLCKGLPNVKLVKASAINLPFKDEIFDFAYSFGVLHHTIDPEKSLREIARVIKKEAHVFLYLYEDHSDNPIKYSAVKFVSLIRVFTLKVPSKILLILSYIASPFVVLFFSYPAKVMRRFSLTRKLSGNMPFNFGTHLFSVAGDIYDRFAAPIEHRYSRSQLTDLLRGCGFSDINITKLKGLAGWVTWGRRI